VCAALGWSDVLEVGRAAQAASQHSGRTDSNLVDVLDALWEVDGVHPVDLQHVAARLPQPFPIQIPPFPLSPAAAAAAAARPPSSPRHKPASSPRGAGAATSGAWSPRCGSHGHLSHRELGWRRDKDGGSNVQMSAPLFLPRLPPLHTFTAAPLVPNPCAAADTDKKLKGKAETQARTGAGTAAVAAAPFHTTVVGGPVDTEAVAVESRMRKSELLIGKKRGGSSSGGRKSKRRIVELPQRSLGTVDADALVIPRRVDVEQGLQAATERLWQDQVRRRATATPPEGLLARREKRARDEAATVADAAKAAAEEAARPVKERKMVAGGKLAAELEALLIQLQAGHGDFANPVPVSVIGDSCCRHRQQQRGAPRPGWGGSAAAAAQCHACGSLAHAAGWTSRAQENTPMYSTYVSQPMDLATMLHKLQAGSYGCAAKLEADLLLLVGSWVLEIVAVGLAWHLLVHGVPIKTKKLSCGL
jgi:hypothetical protein